MRKLTPQEQQWVEYAYPLVKKTMESYNLSENDTIDWHGELSVALCEAVIEQSSVAPSLEYIKGRLQDCIHTILESEQFRVKEIPSGLRPRRAVGRGCSL